MKARRDAQRHIVAIQAADMDNDIQQVSSDLAKLDDAFIALFEAVDDTDHDDIRHMKKRSGAAGFMEVK